MGWTMLVCGLGVLLPIGRSAVRGAIALAELRRSRLADIGVCAHCGYNLHGNRSGLCPECGTPVVHSPQVGERHV